MQFLSRAAIPLMLMSPPEPRPTSWEHECLALSRPHKKRVICSGKDGKAEETSPSDVR